MELKNFISGERIQEIAHVTFFGTSNDNIPNQLKNTKTVLRDRTNFYLDKNENIVYVYGHDLELFFKEIFPEIEKPIKIISHNTDYPVDSKFIQYLDDDKLIHWYGQNAILEHPKLTPVPIGIANKQWPHGNLENLLSVVNSKPNKENIIYKNFDITTNIHVRSHINNITNKNNIFMDKSLPHIEYLTKLAKSLYVISPPGNGIDCHRIWEALYVGTVPIVQKNTAFRNFTHLPILFIENWEEVTIDMVKKRIPEFYSQPFDTSILQLDYWKKIING